MPKLIGTAGHVDHGKTTLIHALTGIDADRLPEEKKRGMTIDIGFAYIDLPGHGRVSIVDVPGHERFLHNMLVGAMGVDVALLCVAADGGVMPQTREHLQVLELLPVERLVVALTRADLVDDDTVALAAEEVRELVAETRFGTAPMVPVSAVTGTGLGALRQTLADALSERERAPAASAALPWVLPIDRVFLVKGHGVVATGTLIQGVVKVGDRAVLEPGGTEVRVRAIHSHSEPVAEARKGMRTAVNLSGVRLEDVRRGMAVGAPGALFETRLLDARIRWIERPKHASRIRLSIGAEEAIGRVFLNDNDPEISQFRLETPIACCRNQALIVRRYSPSQLLGGGRVEVPVAKPRRKSERVVAVTAGEADAAIVEMLADALDGLPTEEIARRLGQSTTFLGPVFEKLLASGKVLGFAGRWYDRSAFAAAEARFLEALAAMHERSPTQAGHPRERVVDRAGLQWSGKPLDRILSRLAQEGKVAVQGTSVRLAGFRVALTERQRALLDRVAAEIEADGWSPAGPQAIADRIRVPVQAVEEIVRLGVEAGDLCRIADGYVLLAAQIAGLRDQLVATFGDRPFTAGEFRDAFGTSRKYAIPLLEYLDSQGVTLRQGDVRRVRREG
ncbi:MAG: selenocysteine-specific translation elongation factor [Fimbriimonadaceae bacterium]